LEVWLLLLMTFDCKEPDAKWTFITNPNLPMKSKMVARYKLATLTKSIKSNYLLKRKAND